VLFQLYENNQLTKEKLDAARNSSKDIGFQNFVKVLEMALPYSQISGNKNLTLQQVEQLVSFKTAVEKKAVMGFVQNYSLIHTMVEQLANENVSSLMTYTFQTKKNAEDFTNEILTKLPGYEAENILKDYARGIFKVSFSLKQNLKKITPTDSFVALDNKPGVSLQTSIKSKSAPVENNFVYKKQTNKQITFKKQEAEVSDVKSALIDKRPENLSSSGQGIKEQVATGAVFYARAFKTDSDVSKVQVDHATQLAIREFARTLGFKITDPIPIWFAGEEGQKCLKLAKEIGIKIDIIGSADMPLFYDGKNRAAWIKVANSNNDLAKPERSQLSIEFFKKLNREISAEAKKNGTDQNNVVLFDIDNAVPQGKLHFFQDNIPDDLKSKYGYVDGDGKKNMTAFMNYLKNVSELKVDENDRTTLIVGTSMFGFNSKDIRNALEYFNDLISSKAVVQNPDGTYEANDIALLNNRFRRMKSDPTLQGVSRSEGGYINEDGRLPNVFARAIMESTQISSRSVTIQSKLDATLTANLEVENGIAVLSVDYRFKNKDGALTPIDFNEQNGAFNLLFRQDNGEEIKLYAIQTENNKIKFAIPRGGGRIIARASTMNGEISSGYVWKTIEAEKVKTPQKLVPSQMFPDKVQYKVPYNLPKSTPQTVSPAPIFGEVKVCLPGDNGFSQDAQMGPPINAVYVKRGWTYDDVNGGYRLPPSISLEEQNNIRTELIASFKADKNFSKYCSGTPTELTNALMQGNTTALQGMLTDAEYTEIGLFRKYGTRQVNISDQSQSSAVLVYDVGVSANFPLGKAIQKGPAQFQNDFSLIPVGLGSDEKTENGIKKLKPGTQYQFKSDNKQYVAVAATQPNGVAVAVYHVPTVPKTLVFGINNKGVVFGDNLLTTTSAEAMLHGRVNLQKFTVNPFIGAGAVFSTSKKSSLSAVGVDLYPGALMRAGVGTRYPLGPSLDAGLTLVGNVLLSGKTAPITTGQVTASLTKTIPKNGLVFDVSLTGVYGNGQPFYSSRLGVEMKHFKVGVEWNFNKFQNANQGTPGVYFNININ